MSQRQRRGRRFKNIDARAAAVAEYVGKEVLICGGRNRDSEVNEVWNVERKNVDFSTLNSIFKH